MTAAMITAILLGAAALIGSLCTGVATILTAIGTRRAVSDVHSTQTANGVTLHTIEKNTNSAATAAKNLEMSLRAEIASLTAQFAEMKQTAALLAQATASRRSTDPDPRLARIEAHTAAIDEHTQPMAPATADPKAGPA
jgi:hypothetical protein